MSAPFRTNYVFVFDKENNPHFVQNYYFANYDDSYRCNIFLETKHYCVLDLFLTDEVEEEGEFLPNVREAEWRAFLPTGPSANAATIIAEAGLGDIAISKLVFLRMDYSSRFILDYSGFVATSEGVEDFDEAFLAQALSLAQAETGSIAEQTDIAANWIVEQVQNGNVTTTK